jgi:phosphatidylglycerophosphate synthase
MVLTVANGITMLRAAAGFAAGLLFLAGSAETAALWTCAVAVALDGLDGWIARRRRQRSALGAFLDPAADKVTMAVVYGVIGIRAESVPVWLFIVSVAFRDVAVTAGRVREYFSVGRPAPVDPVARFKTVLQSVGGLAVLFYGRYIDPVSAYASAHVIALVAIVAVLSYLSWIRYALAGKGGRNRLGSTGKDQNASAPEAGREPRSVTGLPPIAKGGCCRPEQTPL